VNIFLRLVVQFPAGEMMGYFSLSHRVRLALGPTQTPIQWEPGALFPGVERPGH
jgi:hypothetical protein